MQKMMNVKGDRVERAKLKAISGDVTLRDRALGVLRDAILDGHFRVGQKLVERELSELTGVSRSILRECLSHLEATGLIERQSFRGFTVAHLDADKVRNIFELRAVVETLAAELFADRASSEDIAALEAAMVGLEEAARGFDLRDMRFAKERFYNVLFAGCGNVEIRRALENVIDRVGYLRTQLMQDPARRATSLQEMRGLTEALVSRDRDAAREASLAHIEGARASVLARLGAQEDIYNVRAMAEKG